MRPNLPISLMLATTIVGFPLNAQTVNTTDAQSISEEIAQQKKALAMQISARYFDLEKNQSSQKLQRRIWPRIWTLWKAFSHTQRLNSVRSRPITNTVKQKALLNILTQ